MPSSIPERLRKLLAWYEKELLTESWLMTELIPAAAECPPVTLVKEVPAGCLEGIRRRTANIPDAESVVIIRSICNGPNFDFDAYHAWQEEEKKRYIAGLKAWAAYFNEVQLSE